MSTTTKFVKSKYNRAWASKQLSEYCYPNYMCWVDALEIISGLAFVIFMFFGIGSQATADLAGVDDPQPIVLLIFLGISILTITLHMIFKKIFYKNIQKNINECTKKTHDLYRYYNNSNAHEAIRSLENSLHDRHLKYQ